MQAIFLKSCFEDMLSQQLLMSINICCFSIMCEGKCSEDVLCPSDDNDYSRASLISKWDGIHHRYIHCPCMDIQARGVLYCSAYMSQCHSPPFTLHPPPIIPSCQG